ncbi:MAG: hypothetical protein MJA29_08695, partial [Candidatus Omnitrophica bacterium]|nr:hypothetical protein [Candidatus Omnitrophota bacterium]
MNITGKSLFTDYEGNRYGAGITFYGFGFSLRKQSIIRRFAGDSVVKFTSQPGRIPPGNILLLWGSRDVPPDLHPRNQVIRIEDGFLRSVGLGADLVDPLSMVADGKGIYYDATRPSDLEHLLQNAEFSASLLERAAFLRTKIIDNRLSKYCVGNGCWNRSEAPVSRWQKVILVPGQVETDASIRFGAPGIHRNIELLKAVRHAEPEAYIIYKPHPDVVAGLRNKGEREDEAQLWCDEMLVSVSMADLLAEVDEVHVMTSLTGFEALLRGKQVTCYGQPFYSGWGLTRDMMPLSRRTRRLSLDMLTAGSLILYPTYMNHLTGRPASPESVVEALPALREKTPARLSVGRQMNRVVT